ncbi:TetR/AcrR family transcriptional regulator [Cereibacter sp. SYSU M97828]|nr:TetR/AcrR family transcriptional regulator [Cereibacter flavus]
MGRRTETMQENRARLIAAARTAFARDGFAAASMDDLTAAAGLTRGALYHNFGDKKGLLAAVVAQIDSEIAAEAHAAGQAQSDPWQGLLVEGAVYIEMALTPEVQRIVLLDGPAFLGDPSQWPSQNACLDATRHKIAELVDAGVMQPVDVDAAARLLSGAALTAALWVAASPDPQKALPKAVDVFTRLASGLKAMP